MSTKELTITKNTFLPESKRAEEMQITSAESMVEATELLSRANKYLDSVIEYKEKKTKPLNALKKIILDETKPLEQALEALVDTIKDKMSKYQTDLIKVQEKQKQAIASKVSSGYIKVETALTKLEDIKAPEKKVVAEAGQISFQEVKLFEVVNIEELPIAYHLPDLQSIKEMMKQGTELKGVKYWTEQRAINRRN